MKDPLNGSGEALENSTGAPQTLRQAFVKEKLVPALHTQFGVLRGVERYESECILNVRFGQICAPSQTLDEMYRVFHTRIFNSFLILGNVCIDRRVVIRVRKVMNQSEFPWFFFRS